VLGLRFAYLLALVVWLGGLLVLAGVAAPLVFDVLQARVPVEGRTVAGAVFGALLARFHLVGFACGALMVLALAGRAIIGPRPRPFAPRLIVIGAMLALTAAVAVPITGRMEAIQATVHGSIVSLPDDDPRRLDFDRLHRLSTWLLSANMLAGIVLVVWEAREHG
jgi:hypothetical protein